MVRSYARLRVVGIAGETLRTRGNDLDEGVHNGARALRWRRHCAYSSPLRGGTRLAASGSPVRSRLARVAQPFDIVRIHLSERTPPNPCRRSGRSAYATPERSEPLWA